jgi:hypothetical protein
MAWRSALSIERKGYHRVVGPRRPPFPGGRSQKKLPAGRSRSTLIRDWPATMYMGRLLEHPFVAEWLRLGREERDVIRLLEIDT